MAITLTGLIETVADRAASVEPLELLATAAATADEVDDLTDALLSHFVDRCRKDGCSWSQIGTSLGVTKQAVQKRFTRPVGEPAGWERFTGRARRHVLEHAPEAATTMGHGWVGTEHLLIGFWGDPECLAARILERLEFNPDRAIEAVNERVERGDHRDPSYTPRAWSAVNTASRQALELGHNYIGTEHVLLALVSGVGGMAEEILTEAGVRRATIQPPLLETLSGYVARER